MVAIVTGAGLGLQRDSASVVGNRGQLGSAVLGQAGLGVTVNTSNGNLILQSQDELLLGAGLDDVIVNTYNSQGTFTANGWQESYQRHVGTLTGTVNTAGSTITHYTADGSAVVYSYNSTKGLYVGNEAGGAYDTLAFSASTNQWTWQDGKTRVLEVYDNANGGRLMSSADADGNILSYTYTGSQLTRITTAGGDYTTLSYTGTLLTSVVTSYTNASGLQTCTRVRYGYDASNRLQTVTVDLSPNDNAVSDGKTYVTTYGYDGTSNRIASIGQSDGSSLQIAYVQVGSVYKVSSYTQAISSGVSATTSFDYSVAGRTKVTDPQGNATTFVYDGNGQLTQLVSPAPASGGALQATSFVYDANGNLLWSGPTGDANFTSIAQNWADLYKSDANLMTTQSTEMDGGVPVYRRQSTTTPAAGTVVRLGQSKPGMMVVAQGQAVQLSVYTASSGASQLNLWAYWRDANGTWLSSTNLGPIATGGTLGASGVATARFASGSATVPAGAVYVQLAIDVTSDGTGPLNVAIAQPTVTVGGTAAGGAVAPSYTYTYDGNGNLLTKLDTLGNQTVYAYDGNNQLLTKTETPATGSPLTTRYVYDAESHLAFTISPAGEVTQYVYNALGQQTSVIQYTSAADLYTASGNPSAATMTSWANALTDKATTRRTDTTYDARGAVHTVTSYAQTNSDGTGATATATTATYVYDQAGQLLSRQVSGSGATETYVYDGLGRTISVSDFNTRATQTVYTNISSGMKAVVTLANGMTQTSIYDLAGERVSYAVSASGVSTATTSYVYDANGNLIRTTDPMWVSSYFVYDAQNRKVADVAADGQITAYTYNANDQVIATTAYATRLNSTQLSSLSSESAATTPPVRLPSLLPAANTNDRWSWNIYDAAGRLIENIDALGYATTYSYDGADRMVATTQYATSLPGATLVTLKTTPPPSKPVLPTIDATNDRTTRTFYDADGRVAGVLDADGYLTQTFYDDAGLKTQTIAYANQPASSYWATGSLQDLVAHLTVSSDDIHNWWVYDAAGNLRASIDGEGDTTRYDAYTAAGFAGTVTAGQTLDPATLIATPPTMANLPAATGTLEVTSYTYDAYGHVLTRTLTLIGGTTETTTYTYDSAYNLTSVSTASSSSATGGADGRTATVKYDGLGRKIAKLSGVGSAALAALGASPTQAQIDAVWASYGTSYAYDAAGHLIRQTDADGNRMLYYYDNLNRLAYQIDGTGGVVKYNYSVFGEQAGVIRYAVKIAATTLSGLTGGLITSDVISAITPSSNDSHSDINYDADGNVSNTVDALGATTAYTYDAFDDLATVTDPLLVQTKKTYSRRGLLLTSTADFGTGKLNLKTSYAYDAFGRVTNVTDPLNDLTSTTYDRANRVKTQGDAFAKTTSYTYDAFGRMRTMTDRTGAQTSYVHTLFDRQVTVTDPNGVVTTTTNNAYGQTVKIVDGAGGQTIYAYDADGNLTSTTDAVGNVATQNFDHADLLISTVSPRSIITSYRRTTAARHGKVQGDNATGRRQSDV